MPLPFTRRWQVIGQKGRQLWISKHYIRILGPIDDIFGKAAGGIRIRWFNIKCDDDMVQLKAVIHESRSLGSGEYMCLRLKRQEANIQGFVVRETTKIPNKYGMDCEFWADGRSRKAYSFHLTDNPSWIDTLTKNEAIVQADSNMAMKQCSEIPEPFHGEWKLSGTDKVVEFRSKYYRAYGAHGNDPFWRTNTELNFYKLICNVRRIVLKTFMWELPPGSKSQLQCLTLNKDGEYDLTGHAVNMVTSKLPNSQTPEIDCDHGVGKDYTRYPLHLTRQLAEMLAPKPLHNMAEHDKMEVLEEFDEGHQQSDERYDSGGRAHEIADELGYPSIHGDAVPAKAVQHELPLLDSGHSDDHNGHVPSDINTKASAADHHGMEEYENHHQPHGNRVAETTGIVINTTPTYHRIPPPFRRITSPYRQITRHYQRIPRPPPRVSATRAGLAYMGLSRGWPKPYHYQPYAYQYEYQPPNPPYPPPYWVGKRAELIPLSNNNYTGEVGKRNFANYEDYAEPTEDAINVNKELLKAMNSQNELLRTALARLTAYVEKNSASSTTEDWNYVRPYLKQEFHENIDKKALQYQYHDDDD